MKLKLKSANLAFEWNFFYSFIFLICISSKIQPLYGFAQAHNSAGFGRFRYVNAFARMLMDAWLYQCPEWPLAVGAFYIPVF